MNAYKLINFKDILKLWARHWLCFLLLTAGMLGLFFLLPRLPQTPRYLATAQVSLRYTVDSKLDYDTSSKLAAKYNLFDIEPSLQKAIRNSLPQEDGSLSMSLRSIPYHNLIKATAISTVPEHAIQAANRLAQHLLEKNSDAASADIRYVSEYVAEDTETLLRFDFSRKDQISYLVIALFVLAMLLIAQELLRTAVRTEHEAAQISGCDVALDIHARQGLDKVGTETLLALLRHKSIAKPVFLPVREKDRSAALEHALKNELKETGGIYAQCLLEHPQSLDIAKAAEGCFLWIKKDSCDYRDLQKAAMLCRECGVTVYAILIA